MGRETGLAPAVVRGSAVALRVGFQHLRHARKVAFPCRPEKFEGFGIDAQMHGSFARCGGLRNYGIAPEILIKFDLRGIRAGQRFTTVMHGPEFIERVAPYIFFFHLRLPSMH